MRCIISLVAFSSLLYGIKAEGTKAESLKNATVDLFDIEGIIYPPDYIGASRRASWLADTKVYVRGGEYIGFINYDGTFSVPKLPSDVYILEVVSPNYVYESVRVEINSKGKYRVRKINYMQSQHASNLAYPVRMRALGSARYFQPREQWRITDILLNPMVLMMILPMVCVMILPRLMNDPDAKKDMEQIQNLAKYDMPEVSEMITSFFSSRVPEKSNTRAIKQKRK